MSTTYGISIKELELNNNGEIISKYDEDNDIFIIGNTSCFTKDGAIVSKYLPDNTPIYALDNGTDLRTLIELKNYYENYTEVW